MHSVLRLVSWKQGTSRADIDSGAATLASAGRAHGAVAQFIGPTLPGSRNGGDLIWHLAFADGAAATSWEQSPAWHGSAEPALRALAAHVDTASYDHGQSGIRANDVKQGIYRALLFSLTAEASALEAAQLERDLLGLPRHIDRILNWRLSRVARSSGAEPWSYVWEQEFAALPHLTQDYVWHPYHWGHADRWFDPEMPCRIVRSRLCHSFAAIDSSFLSVSR